MRTKNNRILDPLKIEFAERFNHALDVVGAPPKYRGRQEYARKIFGITQQAVHKWLTGESLPDLGRISDMAKILGVRAEWLLTGRGAMFQTEPVSIEVAGLLSDEELQLIGHYRLMSDRARLHMLYIGEMLAEGDVRHDH